MSNGITTASGEVVVRGEEGERTSLGVCVCDVEGLVGERKMETRDEGGTKKGHLEMANADREARVDLH